jgi:zinc D-Ala-D-Ala dipeptidase
MLLFILASCTGRGDGSSLSQDVSDEYSIAQAEDSMAMADEVEPVSDQKIRHEMEITLLEMGLVNITDLDSTIQVEMKYASDDNFLGRDIYDGFDQAYLQPDVARMLVMAQDYLKSIKPGYTLIVYDAARSRSAQQRMWDAVDAPFEEKVKFLANPANGSIHNFGAAVDVSLVNDRGEKLDMGTEFDHMGELAYPTLEAEMLEDGLLSSEQIENRKLLRKVMRHAGFWGIQTEWWHFNACTRDQAREKYPMIE